MTAHIVAIIAAIAAAHAAFFALLAIRSCSALERSFEILLEALATPQPMHVWGVRRFRS